jgi:preprotein translocase subunit SecE
MAKRKKSPKKRKPKGKPLSERLKERDEARASQAEALAEADADELRSEPPPAYDEDGDARYDDDEGSSYDDEDEHDEDEHDEDEQDEDEHDEDEQDEDEQDEDGGDAEEGDGAADEDGEDEEEDDDDDEMAGQLGHQRYVIAGFFGLWVVVAYIAGRALAAAWSQFAARDWFVANVPQLAAVPHEGELISRASVSLVVGGIIVGGVVLRYFYKSEVRTWADEVAEQLMQVKWPTRKEIGNHTVVVIASTTIITLYLTLLDRLWGFVTNLFYSTGA